LNNSQKKKTETVEEKQEEELVAVLKALLLETSDNSVNFPVEESSTVLEDSASKLQLQD